MNREVTADGTGHPGILDRLHELGKERGSHVPVFDAERTIRRAQAIRDAGAVSFWQVLSPTERQAFGSAAHEETFTPGAALMREGDGAHEVMVILDGWVKVSLEEDGRERIVAERGPGDLVGERGTMPGNVRSASVIAIDTVRALVLGTAEYTAFVGEHPGVPDLVTKQTYGRRTDQPGSPGPLI